jgi:hypothetical protein
MLTTIDELAALGADLFIINERLPASVSGHIICILLHYNPVTRSTPQILVSGSPLLSKFAELAEADASMRKPLIPDQLLTLVKELCLTNKLAI